MTKTRSLVNTSVVSTHSNDKKLFLVINSVMSVRLYGHLFSMQLFTTHFTENKMKISHI